MSRSSSNAGAVAISGGTSVFALLTAVFAGAKLFGFSDMSWIMVLSPIWAPTLFVLGIMLIMFCAIFLYHVIQEVIINNKARKARNKVDPK